MATSPPPLLSLAQAARALQCHRRTLASWIADGRFPAYRTPGGRYQIARADVEAGLHLEPAGLGRRADDPGAPAGSNGTGGA